MKRIWRFLVWFFIPPEREMTKEDQWWQAIR
jgi:hypothetical protein